MNKGNTRKEATASASDCGALAPLIYSLYRDIGYVDSEAGELADLLSWKF